MERKAILIAADPGSKFGFSPVPEVHTDVNLWSAFLNSKNGGAWTRDEIVTLDRNYNKDDLLQSIRSAKGVEYSLIVFAGHGQTVKRNFPWLETEIFLCDGDTVLERELNPGTPRCTIVLDCCRGNEEPPEQVKVAMFESAFDSTLSRVKYDLYLGKAEAGLVKIYATQVGHNAADDYSFSQHFLFQANEWALKNKGVLSLKDGVDLATTSLQIRNPQQKPEYNGGRRLHHFPLAVSV